METTTQPAPRKEPFLRNYWYVAALANEVRPDAIFSRTLLNEPVIFYRRAAAATSTTRCTAANWRANPYAAATTA